MKRVPQDLFELYKFALDGGNYQTFVDKYDQKYDTLEIDGFDFAPTQIGYTFSQLISSVGATTLPAYVDPESPGYERMMGEAKGISDNIPTQKSFYSLNRTIVREKMQLIQQYGWDVMNNDMRNIFLGMLDESTDGLIQGYYNALTHQRMRIVSNGKFVIDINNNPRGLKGIEIGFGIPANHFDTLTTTARWWTNTDMTTEGTASDPIQYMKDKLDAIEDDFHISVPMKVEMSKKLFKKFINHSKVRAKVGLVLMPTLDAAGQLAYANIQSEEVIKAHVEAFIGAPIVVRDTYAWVDKPDAVNHTLTQDKVENFNPKNIAFVPQGKLGNIMGVTPLTLGYEADKVAFHNGGRLALSQRANPQTHSIYIESEAAQICVPSVPQAMFISTVTA